MKFLFASLFHFILIQTIFIFIHAMYHFYVSSRAFQDYYYVCTILYPTIEACYNMVYKKFCILLLLLNSLLSYEFLCIFVNINTFYPFSVSSRIQTDLDTVITKSCLWLTMSLSLILSFFSDSNWAKLFSFIIFFWYFFQVKFTTFSLRMILI